MFKSIIWHTAIQYLRSAFSSIWYPAACWSSTGMAGGLSSLVLLVLSSCMLVGGQNCSLSHAGTSKYIAITGSYKSYTGTCMHYICIGYATRWRLLRDIATLPRAACRPEVVYTVKTDTKLYYRLVPWGIATHACSNGIKRAITYGQCQRTDRREVELREIRAMTADHLPGAP